MSDKKNDRMEKTVVRLERLVEAIERTGIDDLIAYRSNPRKMLKNSFLIGLLRGLGTAVGFTVLGAVIVYVLQALARANLPIIGDLIASIVRLVNSKL